MDFSRVDRLQSQMVRVLATILLKDLKDAPPHMITFTRAEISKDLKLARIYFTVFGNTEALDRSYEFLKRHSGVIRKMLGSRMRIKHNPELQFKFDDSTDHVLKVGELLDRIKRQDEPDGNSK